MSDEATARAIVARELYRDDLMFAIAAALAAERERCAKKVESCATGEDDKVRMKAIAATIRKDA